MPSVRCRLLCHLDSFYSNVYLDLVSTKQIASQIVVCKKYPDYVWLSDKVIPSQWLSLSRRLFRLVWMIITLDCGIIDRIRGNLKFFENQLALLICLPVMDFRSADITEDHSTLSCSWALLHTRMYHTTTWKWNGYVSLLICFLHECSWRGISHSRLGPLHVWGENRKCRIWNLDWGRSA